MANTLSNDVISLQAQVEHLKSEVLSCLAAPTLLHSRNRKVTTKFGHSLRAHAQVLRLQKKLGEAHVSDVGALRRAHATISQHSQALQIEAQACASPACMLPYVLHSACGSFWFLCDTASVCKAQPLHDRCISAD